MKRCYNITWFVTQAQSPSCGTYKFMQKQYMNPIDTYMFSVNDTKLQEHSRKPKVSDLLNPNNEESHRLHYIRSSTMSTNMNVCGAIYI